MQPKAILNSIEKHKGFIYDGVAWDAASADKTLLIGVRPRQGSRGHCSGCAKRSRTYDTMKPRRFQFVPMWGIAVFFVSARKTATLIWPMRVSGTFGIRRTPRLRRPPARGLRA